MKTRKKILSIILIATGLGLSIFANADGSESNKIISYLYYGADGVIIVAVQSPSSSATCPFGGLMSIPATAASKMPWYSMLLGAKMSQAKVTIDFKTDCTLKGVSLS